MTLSEKINEVIGNKYDYTNSNCWHLVKHLNENAPDIEEVHTSIYSTAKKFKQYEEKYKKDCSLVLFPDDGDIVIMGRNNLYTHAGIFYNSGIVHASKVGVIWQPLREMKREYPKIKAYKCK